jgi:hypothetical protein
MSEILIALAANAVLFSAIFWLAGKWSNYEWKRMFGDDNE